MYIRRKVFSLLQDENGEERYFSTTEFVREDSEEKLFAKKEDDEKSGKGKKAAIIGGAAVAPVAVAGGYQLVRHGQNKRADKALESAIEEGENEKIRSAAEKVGKRNKVDNFGDKVQGSAKNAAKKTKETVEKAKDATVKGAKKAGNFLERAWKGETNGFSRDAQGYARKNGRFAKESAMKKNAYKNRALMIGGTAATVATPIVAVKKPTTQEIVAQYNKAKRQYTAFFQKTIEIEDELAGHSLVLKTLSKLNDNRRCFRKIGGVLVEKDLTAVKKDLEVEVNNFKATLDAMYKAMDQQEAIMIDYEKKYPEILRPTAKKAEEKKEDAEKKSSGGVLI